MAVDLLGIGSSGLSVSKKSLQTTGHNIANANTEGFSRQRTDQATNPPVGTGNHVQGTGVHIRSIKRVHDELVEKRLNDNLSQHSFNAEKQFQLAQVEGIFNEVNSEGLNKIMNRFFNAFRELSIQPENAAIRSTVREAARLVIKDLRTSRERLEQAANSIEGKMKVSVGEINNFLNNIRDLNVAINQLEVTHSETGDLRDQRDRAIRSLSEYFDIQTWYDEKNRFVVNAIGVGTLVTGGHAMQLKTGSLPPESEGDPPVVDIFIGKRKFPLSEKLEKGKIGALAQVRRDVVRNLQGQLDYIAFNLVKMVNAIHRKGYSAATLPDEKGNPVQKTGVNFFEDIKTEKRAAESVDLSDEIKGDINNIVTGLAANSPGDNRVAIAISQLQHEKILRGRTATYEEEFLKSVGNVGLLSAKARLDAEQSEGILTQTKQFKERISGVSIDEETTNMVRFQHAYDASARVLKTADEMFKTVLGIKP